MMQATTAATQESPEETAAAHETEAAQAGYRESKLKRSFALIAIAAEKKEV